MSIYDLEHISFLKKKKREKFSVCFFRILILVLFIIIWEILAKFNLINTFFFSSPCNIFSTIVSLIKNGDLFRHIGITLYEVIVSFGIASIIGIVVAFLLWKFPILSKIVDPYLTILNSLPKVALGPLIIIWIGASINSIIFMALMISTFVTIISIYNGFVNTDSGYIALMKSFGAKDIDIFKKVIFPSNLYNIVSAMKINVSMSLIGVIMGELLVSKEGLGYLIMYGSQVFNINLVISGVVILGIISYIMYYVVSKIEFFIKNKKREI